MKIQCDVCGQEEASVLCTADEAALCRACDNRVHNANKLATKHPRFALLHPRVGEYPLCDICHEKRALMLCQEDRAFLCRDCDIPIHNANEHTKNHNRFLLTGVKISAAGATYQAATSSSGSQTGTEIKSFTNVQPYSGTNCSVSSSNPWRGNNDNTQVSTSTISEYLMETLPGWHVDDLLDPSSHSGLYKIYDEMSHFANQEGGGTFYPFSTKDVTKCKKKSS